MITFSKMVVSRTGRSQSCFSLEVLHKGYISRLMFVICPETLWYYSHWMKKIRNSILSSGCARYHTRNVQLYYEQKYNPIMWQQWLDAVQWDRSTNARLVHHRITNSHLSPTSDDTMRNQLAEDMLNKNMLNLMTLSKFTKWWKAIVRRNRTSQAYIITDWNISWPHTCSIHWRRQTYDPCWYQELVDQLACTCENGHQLECRSKTEVVAIMGMSGWPWKCTVCIFSCL